jgi:hypothetical protein
MYSYSLTEKKKKYAPSSSPALLSLLLFVDTNIAFHARVSETVYWWNVAEGSPRVVFTFWDPPEFSI